MGKFGLSFYDCARPRRRNDDCLCDNERPYPPYPPYPPCPPCPRCMSSYVEAVGNKQDVEPNGDVAFDIDPDYLDIAGYGIELNETGTVFTITREGLYHIEWSVNLGQAEHPVLLGLMEKGEPASALSKSVGEGNFSSGALINVGADDIPFTISLHNFGALLSLENPDEYENTAASIRILRFADGPEVVV